MAVKLLAYILEVGVQVKSRSHRYEDCRPLWAGKGKRVCLLTLAEGLGWVGSPLGGLAGFSATGDDLSGASVPLVAAEAFTPRFRRNPVPSGLKDLGKRPHGKRGPGTPQRARFDLRGSVADCQFVRENQNGSPHTEKCQNEGRLRQVTENNRGIK
jgi:hypothetical protein